MRETLDCGVLMVPAHAGWMDAWMQRHAGQTARVRLHAVTLDDGALVVGANGIAVACRGAQAAGHSLARLAVSLRRFDACLLPVTPDTLGWTRTALSCAGGGVQTPLIGLARGLKAAAVQDLLALGMKDFVRDPLCIEELRVRVDRVAGDRGGARYAVGAPADRGTSPAWPAPHRGVREPMAPYAGACSSEPGHDGGHDVGHGMGPCLGQGAGLGVERGLEQGVGQGLGQGIGQGMGQGISQGVGCDAGRSAGQGAGQRGADARPRLSREALDSGLLAIQAAPRVHPDEPFRLAKSRVVDSFERDYVRTALSRHSGNVARAARASAKHRRAFWALMRKHHIDAAPYRPRLPGKEQSD